MKMLALAVLLTVMQASPPIPQQASDTNTGKGQPVQTHADTNKKPSEQGTPAVQTIRTQPNENTNPSKSNENAEKPVRIRELPPVSVTRDWMDALALAFSGILLIVGIIGVRAAYKTLKQVEIQAGIMRGQLKAMQGQISAAERATATVISKERARVRIKLGELKIDTIDNKFWLANVDIEVSNLGAMKAFPSGTQQVLFLSQSSEAATKAGFLNSLIDDSVILPDQTIHKNVYCIFDVGSQTIKDLNEESVFMHLYGDVHYTDVFGEYVTPFRYIWTVTARYAIATEVGIPGSEKIDIANTLYGEWRRHGPESGNAAT